MLLLHCCKVLGLAEEQHAAGAAYVNDMLITVLWMCHLGPASWKLTPESLSR